MFVATIIRVLHVLFVLAILFIPFSSNTQCIEFYVVFVPFMVLHWVLNSDECVLTYIECLLTGSTKKESFLGRLLGPIYTVSNTEIYLITFILYAIAVYRVGWPWTVATRFYKTYIV